MPPISRPATMTDSPAGTHRGFRVARVGRRRTGGVRCGSGDEGGGTATAAFSATTGDGGVAFSLVGGVDGRGSVATTFAGEPGAGADGSTSATFFDIEVASRSGTAYTMPPVLRTLSSACPLLTNRSRHSLHSSRVYSPSTAIAAGVIRPLRAFAARRIAVSIDARGMVFVGGAVAGSWERSGFAESAIRFGTRTAAGPESGILSLTRSTSSCTLPVCIHFIRRLLPETTKLTRYPIQVFLLVIDEMSL